MIKDKCSGNSISKNITMWVYGKFQNHVHPASKNMNIYTWSEERNGGYECVFFLKYIYCSHDWLNIHTKPQQS